MIGALSMVALIMLVMVLVALPAILVGRIERGQLLRRWLHIGAQLPSDCPQSQETTFLSVPVRFGSFTLGNKFDLHAFRLHLDLGDRGIRLRQEQSLWGVTDSRMDPLFIPWERILKATYRSHESGITESTGLFFEVDQVLDEAGSPFILQVYSDSAVIESLRNRAAESLPMESA
ncbi:MAG TPA: hypothetical protein VJ505_10950 [Holophagaceae bacterium]|nr:hypothetical protein [Holophagaceae bacterium]